MWAQVVFWVLLVPLIILLFVVYIKSRKLYRLLYIVSVFSYAMTIMYSIDAYQLGRNAIIGLLALSSVLMIYVGYWFHKHQIMAKPARKKR